MKTKWCNLQVLVVHKVYFVKLHVRFSKTEEEKLIESRSKEKDVREDKNVNFLKYQPSGDGGTRSPPATPVGPKMADGVWKGVYP